MTFLDARGLLRPRAALWLALLTMTSSVMAQEVHVAGVAVADQVMLGGQRLLLNGSGTHSLFGFQVYVASLYLPTPTRDANRILERDSARRLRIALLRDTTTEQNLDTLKGGLADNNSPEELAAIQPEIDLFFVLLRQVHEVPAGTSILLDYLPGRGTWLRIGERPLGGIPGERFNRALLKIWLGGDPIQVSLKKSLLGIDRPAL